MQLHPHAPATAPWRPRRRTGANANKVKAPTGRGRKLSDVSKMRGQDLWYLRWRVPGGPRAVRLGMLLVQDWRKYRDEPGRRRVGVVPAAVLAHHCGGLAWIRRKIGAAGDLTCSARKVCAGVTESCSVTEPFGVITRKNLRNALTLRSVRNKHSALPRLAASPARHAVTKVIFYRAPWTPWCCWRVASERGLRRRHLPRRRRPLRA